MTYRKKVLVLTTDAGLGHRKAAEAIEKALNQSYGDRVAVDVVNILEDARVPELLRQSQHDYDRLITQNADLYALGFQLSDTAVPSTLVETAVSVILSGPTHELIEKYEPDVIVSTHPLCQMPLQAAFKAMGKSVPTLTVVTDMVTIHQLWFDAAVDLCVVPTATARDLALDNGLEAKQVAVIGIPVNPDIPNEKRSQTALREFLGWQPDVKTVLAVGGKRVNHLRESLAALNHANLPIQIVAVAGGDDALYQHFMETEWHNQAYVYNFVDNLPAMMQAADALICKAGGLIVTEALACGLAMLLVDVLPGQEQGNADYVVEGGAAIMAETPLQVLETAYHWFVQDARNLQMKGKAARELGHPQAAFEIAERIWNL